MSKSKVYCFRNSVYSAFVAAAAFSAMVLVGCGSDKDNNPVGGGGGLVLPDGCAWVYHDNEEDYTYGRIFKSDGVAVELEYYGDIWVSDDFGTWTTNGNKIIWTEDGEQGIVTYSVSGNTLKITWTDDGETETETYTKTCGLTIVPYDYDNDLYKKKQRKIQKNLSEK